MRNVNSQMGLSMSINPENSPMAPSTAALENTGQNISLNY